MLGSTAVPQARRAPPEKTIGSQSTLPTDATYARYGLFLAKHAVADLPYTRV